jgi:hypothetical protein
MVQCALSLIFMYVYKESVQLCVLSKDDPVYKENNKDIA